MISKLLWGVAYTAIFVVSFLGGMLVNTVGAPSFAGITNVEWDDSVGTVVEDLSYAEGESHTLDLYLPADRAAATKLVVYLHAGGFTGGDKSDDAGILKHFVSEGYVAAGVNYSLRSDLNETSVTEMTDDVKTGIAAAVRAAADRGYIVDAMVVAGGSAGGNLAMTYAYRDAVEAPVPVAAVISLVGPASFDPRAWFGIDDEFVSDASAQAGAAFVSIITGDAISPDMMRSGQYQTHLKDVSPLMLVTPDAPASLLAYGELDKVAPYAASRDMEDVLERNGVPHDVLVFPNSGHALNRDPALSQELGLKIEEYLRTYAPLGPAS